jgi:UDP-N-acetylglucosamine 2-epimerase (non-hydrolysing)
MSRRIAVIFGTRPEATKMAPVIRALQARPDWFEVRVILTGQHREQLEQVMQAFAIAADHNLAIMTERQSLNQVLVRAIAGLDQLLETDRPDLVLVHGDTTTTAAGSLAAFNRQIPVGHVEAGLRTHHKWNPYPEELNRRVAGVVADLHFAPTGVGRENLLRENVPDESIFVTGQTGVDAALATFRQQYRFTHSFLNTVDFGSQRVITVTAHRRENLGEPMRQMFRALRDLVDKYPDVLLIYPVHLNPAVREIAFPLLGDHPRISLLDPISYPDMINLASRSYLAMTDSGGIQEETPSLGVPHVLMRETTERPEGVAAGVVLLSGTSYDGVLRAGDLLLSDQAVYRKMARAKNPFGDGRASERIARFLAWHFGLSDQKPEPF